MVKSSKVGHGIYSWLHSEVSMKEIISRKGMEARSEYQRSEIWSNCSAQSMEIQLSSGKNILFDLELDYT